MKNHNRNIRVYSTDFGRICPKCDNPVDNCCCSSSNTKGPSDGIIRVSRQTKGRKGSGVSIISGLILEDTEIKKIAKLLKKKCGSGGTVKGGSIEIQGDHRDVIVKSLLERGFKAKLSGG